MTEEPAAARRVVLTALVAVCVVGFLSTPAVSAPEKLRDGLFKKQQTPGRQFNAVERLEHFQ